jgi:hypothetical protein
VKAKQESVERAMMPPDAAQIVLKHLSDLRIGRTYATSPKLDRDEKLKVLSLALEKVLF